MQNKIFMMLVETLIISATQIQQKEIVIWKKWVWIPKIMVAEETKGPTIIREGAI